MSQSGRNPAGAGGRGVNEHRERNTASCKSASGTVLQPCTTRFPAPLLLAPPGKSRRP